MHCIYRTHLIMSGWIFIHWLLKLVIKEVMLIPGMRCYFSWKSSDISFCFLAFFIFSFFFFLSRSLCSREIGRCRDNNPEIRKVVLKISHYSQKKTCAGVSFTNNSLENYNFIKKTPAQVLSCEYFEIKSSYFEEHLRTAAPGWDLEELFQNSF